MADKMEPADPRKSNMTGSVCRKPLSWTGTAILFLFMVACYLGFSALSPLRHQMHSIHSIFWTFAAPWSIGCIAVLALAVQFIPSLVQRLRRPSSGR
jgi:hypothetical protein